ncbi:MAG: hypothetical protein FJX74_01915 [Armatimonadetes bacterium]|nr:hypothetical protein [Armatimonadota bacterium]
MARSSPGSKALAKGKTVTLVPLEVTTASIVPDADIERSVRPADLALGASALSQLGLLWPGISRAVTSGRELYQVTLSPALQAGVDAGRYAQDAGSALVRSQTTGRIVGHGALKAAGDGGVLLANLSLTVATATIQLQLWGIARRLDALRDKIDQIAAELEIGRKARVFGSINAVRSALDCGDLDQCRRELTSALPHLEEACEESIRFEEMAWGKRLPSLARRRTPARGRSTLNPLRIAGSAVRVGTTAVEARTKKPKVVGWVERYLAGAQCRWLSQLTLYATRAALEQPGNAARERARLVDFATSRAPEALSRVARAFGLAEPAGMGTPEWLRESSVLLGGDEQLRRLLQETAALAQSTDAAMQQLQAPKVRYAVRVVPMGWAMCRGR